MPRQPEFEMQRAIYMWLSVSMPELPVQGSAAGAYLAGTRRQRAKQAAAMKAKGVSAGYPDLMVHYPGGSGEHGLGIELKVGSNAQTQAQLLWEAKLKAAGYAYVVAKSVEEAKRLVREYLHGGSSSERPIKIE